MKVSIIIPVYNAEKYLDKCLDSVVNQTLKDIEIIVVNDGSTDKSQLIIDKYKNNYPLLVKSFIKENGGQSSARNMALKSATGKYIGFVDSDDWVDNDMYEVLYDAAEKEDADVVICDTADHYANKDVWHKPSDVRNKLRQTPSPCNKLFKATLIGQMRYIDGIWYEDFNFVTKLLLTTDKIARCHRCFYHCNCGDESTMNNNNSIKNLDMITAIDDIISFAKEKSLYEKYKDDIDFMIIDHILITTINRVCNQKNKQKHDVIKALRNYVKTSVPNMSRLQVYKDMPGNRRIVAALNLHGMYWISKCLLKIKSKLS